MQMPEAPACSALCRVWSSGLLREPGINEVLVSEGGLLEAVLEDTSLQVSFLTGVSPRRLRPPCVRLSRHLSSCVPPPSSTRGCSFKKNKCSI